jgi:hypothetical protein
MLMHVGEQLNRAAITESRMGEKAKAMLQLCERVSRDECLLELQIGVWDVGGGKAACNVMDREKHLLW